MDFASAAEVLGQVGRVHLSASSVWQQTQKWGEAYRQVEEQAQRQAGEVEMRNGVVLGEAQGGQRMGVAMDGCLIHIRDEGWKEVKVGCVFEVGKRTVIDEITGEKIEIGRAVHNSYVAHLGGPEAFGQKVWAEAKGRGWNQALDTQIVGDGAVWIWNLAAEHFYDSQQAVDWFHAKEHLAKAGQMLRGEATPQFYVWLDEQETCLFQGHAEQLAALLRREAQQEPQLSDGLLQEAGYFENNKRRMNYLELRNEGWVIGSGMVESGGKQFKHRLAGPGMQWSRKGAERMLLIRSAMMSNRFDQIWQKAYNLPQN
jgi:hypothetical protein